MPAKSNSPATSAASLAVGSSTTTTMNRCSRGGPPSAAGKSGFATNTQRRCGSWVTKRNGPFPMGRAFHAASRRRACGTESSRCAGRIARSVSTSGKPRCASPNRSTTVDSSGARTAASGAGGAAPPQPREREQRPGRPSSHAWILAARGGPREIRPMLRMLWQRALVGVAVVTGVVTLTFLLLHAAPGDPAERLLGPAAAPQQVEAVRHALELDRPLTVQYASWLRRFVRGDWGTSITTGRPVGAMLRAAWPATARLVALALLLSYTLGLLVGAVQAASSRARLDTPLSVATVTRFAHHGFMLVTIMNMMVI